MNPLNIHILGVGSIGGLIANELHLAYKNNVNINLLMRNSFRLNKYVQNGSRLTVNKIESNGNTSTHISPLPGITIDSLKNGEEDIIIDNLIVSTKVHQTLPALGPYINHLNEQSNVLFIQNGMGVIEKVTETFWPILPKRPKFYKGVVTHGVYKSSPDVINQVGFGDIKLSYIPKQFELQPPETPSELINLITGIPSLNAKFLGSNEFAMSELEKLAINCCINPLTSVLDCLNGDLLFGTHVPKIMRRLLSEFVAVIRISHVSLFNECPEANGIFTTDRLLNRVFEVIKVTAENSSSMREDVRALQPTEIDYINGYISQLGVLYSVPTPTNNMLISMVKSKSSIEKSLDETAADLLV